MDTKLIAAMAIMAVVATTSVFAADLNVTGTAQSAWSGISGFFGGASPYLLIGFGILLIFIQKLAKIAGIILLIVGLASLLFSFL